MKLFVVWFAGYLLLSVLVVFCFDCASICLLIYLFIIIIFFFFNFGIVVLLWFCRLLGGVALS